MATNYTFDEITAKVTSRGSKASKVDWLTKEAGFGPVDAEITYRLIMSVTEKPATPSRRRRVREAVIELMHFTMGVEIECTNLNRQAVIDACAANNIEARDMYYYHHTNNAAAYELKTDGSLHSSRGDRYGTCEIVTPVLHDLSSLEVVCDIINRAGAKVNKSCGLHVHFGASQFTDAQWRRILINYANLEDVIDGFMAESRRGNGCAWCKSMKDAARMAKANPNATRRDLQSYCGRDRYYKVNLMAFEGHSTIEFRQHAGTTNFKKIENWVKFLAGLLTWSIQHEELIRATTINDVPFLTEEQKRFFSGRQSRLSREAEPSTANVTASGYETTSDNSYADRAADIAAAFAR